MNTASNLSCYHSRGFSLIELMVVVAIIGILTQFALPAYSEYVAQGRIADGQKALATFSLDMETYFQNKNSYGNGACGVSPDSKYDTSNFDIQCSLTDAGYTAKAVGKGNASGYTYAITETGARTTESFKGSSTSLTCWSTTGSSC